MKRRDYVMEIFELVNDYVDDNEIPVIDAFDSLLRISACYLSDKADEEDLREICRTFYEYCQQAVEKYKYYTGFKR